MLLDKYVKIKWQPPIKKWYELKGYVYTKINDEFEVKVEDLQDGSAVRINVRCDNCNEIINIMWYKYKKYVKENGTYYCKKCAHKLFAGENLRLTNLKNGKSFEQWCIENNRQDVLDRWDYELNNLKPSEVSFGSGGKNKKGYYFKCPQNLHKSELKNITTFTSGQEGSIRCNQCNSFAQWGIDNLGEDFLEKYWDYEKNNEIGIDPWEVSFSSAKNIYIICQEKDYHGSYKTSCHQFRQGSKCNYCSNHHGKVHPLDSLGTLYPQSLEIWSDKNKKSPFEYAPKSGQKVWWRCSDKIHKDYQRNILNSNNYKFRCPECQYSKGEEKIFEYLTLNNWVKILQSELNNFNGFNNIDIYIAQMTFDGLVGVKKGLLSYDFYIPKYNLLIEYQGEYHDGNTRNQSNEDINRQKEHDRRKKEYAKSNGYNFLEIWYWDFDNIEEILEMHLNNF